MPDFSDAPIVVFWETTRACALKCLHCRAAAQRQRHPLELDTREGSRLLDDLASFPGPPIVILTGGDPFMRQDLFDLLAYGMGLGLRMALSPSVTKLVTRGALEKLRRLGLSRISFSLDGSKPQIHDSFRRVPGSFDDTLARIQDALDVGLSLQVNTAVSRHNMDDLPEIADLTSNFTGIALWDVFFLVPTGRGQRDDVLSAADHERVYEWLYALDGSVPFAIKTTLGQSYRRVVFHKALAEGRTPGEAWARIARPSTNDGKGVCFISHVGAVYPSGFMPISRGNVRKTPVVDIYRYDPVFQALRDPTKLKGKSGRCEFHAVCGGSRARAYAYTGDHLGPEPCCIYEPEG